MRLCELWGGSRRKLKEMWKRGGLSMQRCMKGLSYGGYGKV